MKRLWNTYLVACAVVATLLAAPSPARAGAIISVAPSTMDVTVGDTFSVEILIADAVGVMGYQFSLAFNESILRADGVTDGTFLVTPGLDCTGGGPECPFPLPSTIDNATGSISFISMLLLQTLSGMSGNGVLATVQFTAVGDGTSAITPLFEGANVDGLFDLGFLPIDGVQFQAGEATVQGSTAVPEPATVLALSLGLGAAVLRRRRRA